MRGRRQYLPLPLPFEFFASSSTLVWLRYCCSSCYCQFCYYYYCYCCTCCCCRCRSLSARKTQRLKNIKNSSACRLLHHLNQLPESKSQPKPSRVSPISGHVTELTYPMWGEGGCGRAPRALYVFHTHTHSS